MTKPKQTSTTEQKRKSDVDPQEISGPKTMSSIPSGFQVTEWLIFSENHIKGKTCLDVYGLLAKLCQAFVHVARNFWDP